MPTSGSQFLHVFKEETRKSHGISHHFSHLFSRSSQGQSWAAVPARGDVPSPRYLHSAVSEARRMWIYGGRDETDLFEARNVFKRDLFVLLNNNGFYFNT